MLEIQRPMRKKLQANAGEVKENNQLKCRVISAVIEIITGLRALNPDWTYL